MATVTEYIASPSATLLFTFIDNVDDVFKFLSLYEDRSNLPSTPSSLYFDLDGNDLSRSDTLSLLQIYARLIEHTFLLNVTTLGKVAFKVKGLSDQNSVIFSNHHIPKVFFDLRIDSNSLFVCVFLSLVCMLFLTCNIWNFLFVMVRLSV